jgi:hypothetical protein
VEAQAAALWRRALAASSLTASRWVGDEQEDLAKGSGWTLANEMKGDFFFWTRRGKKLNGESGIPNELGW